MKIVFYVHTLSAQETGHSTKTTKNIVENQQNKDESVALKSNGKTNKKERLRVSKLNMQNLKGVNKIVYKIISKLCKHRILFYGHTYILRN